MVGWSFVTSQCSLVPWIQVQIYLCPVQGGACIYGKEVAVLASLCYWKVCGLLRGSLVAAGETEVTGERMMRKRNREGGLGGGGCPGGVRGKKNDRGIRKEGGEREGDRNRHLSFGLGECGLVVFVEVVLLSLSCWDHSGVVHSGKSRPSGQGAVTVVCGPLPSNDPFLFLPK